MVKVKIIPNFQQQQDDWTIPKSKHKVHFILTIQSFINISSSVIIWLAKLLVPKWSGLQVAVNAVACRLHVAAHPRPVYI